MLSLGIDLGGTNIAVGAVNNQGIIVAKKSAPTNANRKAEMIVDDIVELCSDLSKEIGITLDKYDSIGIAIPGGVDEISGNVIFAPNIPFSGLNISEILSQKFGGKKVGVINDANAALMAELKFGAAVGFKDVVMITIGTGIGGAIAINGKILNGTNGMAGELGHVVIERNGKKCSCGRRGCFEIYASATALTKLTEKEIKKCRKAGENTIMSTASKINAQVAFDAYKQGDSAAQRVIAEYIDALSCGIVSLINIFQPELFVIGGGVSGQKQFLLDLLVPNVAQEQYSRNIERKTKLLTALCGNDAGIIGAAFA